MWTVSAQVVLLAVLRGPVHPPPVHNRNYRRRPVSSLITRRPPLLPLLRGGASARLESRAVEGDGCRRSLARAHQRTKAGASSPREVPSIFPGDRGKQKLAVSAAYRIEMGGTSLDEISNPSWRELMAAVTSRFPDVHLSVAFRAALMPGANGVQVADFGFPQGHFLGLPETGDARSIGLLFRTLRMRPAGGVTRQSTDRAQAAGFGGQERIGFSFCHRDCSGPTKWKEW